MQFNTKFSCASALHCRHQGDWKKGLRHGHGLMVFADGTRFKGAWEEDEWLQSAAEPSLCRLKGPGLSRAVAGTQATFSIRVSAPCNCLGLLDALTALTFLPVFVSNSLFFLLTNCLESCRRRCTARELCSDLSHLTSGRTLSPDC